MTGKSESRQEPRAPIELKVEYQRLNRFFFDYAKNISKGGTFINTDKPLPVGTAFVFKLYVPTLAEPLVLQGEVESIHEGTPSLDDRPRPEQGEGHGAGMGIRFVYRDDEERREVKRVVERLMIESLGQLIYSHLTAGGA